MLERTVKSSHPRRNRDSVESKPTDLQTNSFRCVHVCTIDRSKSIHHPFPLPCETHGPQRHAWQFPVGEPFTQSISELRMAARGRGSGWQKD